MARYPAELEQGCCYERYRLNGQDAPNSATSTLRPGKRPLALTCRPAAGVPVGDDRHAWASLPPDDHPAIAWWLARGVWWLARGVWWLARGVWWLARGVWWLARGVWWLARGVWWLARGRPHRLRR